VLSVVRMATRCPVSLATSYSAENAAKGADGVRGTVPLTPPPPLRRMSDVRNEYLEGLREWIEAELELSEERVD
jgi:hypothetical protein